MRYRFNLALVVWLWLLPTVLMADPQQDIADLSVRADAGEAAAQFSLGTAYDSGHGVKQDMLKAALWYERAAKQSHVDAQFNLAVLYDEGEGVRQDYRQSVYWYQQAADQGMPEANNNLGLMYASGRGVDQDYERAYACFKVAAQKHFTDSQYNLGLLYQSGLGTQQDLLLALELFARAKGGHPGAAQAYELLFEQLSPQQRKTALSGLN